MEKISSWPSAPKNQPQYPEPVPKRYFFVKIPMLAIGFGLALGFWDVHCTSNLVDWITFGVAMLLGCLHPKTFLISAFLLSSCLYVMHVSAIQHGVKQPYVEPDVDHAIARWQSVFPNVLGALIGAIVKIFVRYEPMGPENP